MSKDYAVYIRDANKSYGDKEILRNFCMTVPRGCIYGLLGASGCGKTTLLNCIVGRKYFNSGELVVLGGKPGTEGSGIPGPRVGYMPQEIALVGEFTVSDAIYYFGRLAYKKDSDIQSSYEELKQILNLPPDERYIQDCSGGQQRRVSLAAALIHKPELLILDEPTVGVDPVLREKIWQYLLVITQRDNTAIIITTHYIEETSNANLIGLMRGGRLLAEASPKNLLNKFNTNSLEEVFLILSQNQESGNLDVIYNNQSASTLSIQSVAEETNHGSVEVLTPKTVIVKEKKTNSLKFNKHRTKALMNKHWKQFSRNTSGWIFLLSFPILEILAFLWAVGPPIKNIPIAVVNDENMNNACGNFSVDIEQLSFGATRCHMDNLGCKFLEYLDDPMLNPIKTDNLEDALEGVHHGKYVGVIYFSENYTKAAEQRFNDGPDTTDFALDNGQVKAFLDMSNRQIGYTIKYKLMDLYIDYQKIVFKSCQFREKYADKPINFLDPVYGVDGEHYTEFMVPGIMMTMSFFGGALLTSHIILTDRLEGIWDRSAVAGVTALEITVTHFILQFCVILFQNFEIFVLVFYYKGIQSIGSLWVLFLILALNGIVGMACGFWISIISINHSMGNILTTGIFYPMILLCGVVWPVEGQPLILRFISKCLPFTIPTESFRNVYMKGWGISHMEVLNGIGIELAWALGLVMFCIYRLKVTQ